MEATMIRPMAIGETRELGALMPGLSADNLMGKVREIHGVGPTAEYILDITYMGVFMGEAILSKNGDGWLWVWK